jgi:hypothetical protein
MARHNIINQIIVTTTYVNCNIKLVLASLRGICDHYILNSLYIKGEVLIYTYTHTYIIYGGAEVGVQFLL